MIFDPDDPQGRHGLDRLERAFAAWLTTVTADGQPQTMPVWFIWDGEEIVVYSDHRAKRNRNLESNPRLSFHLGDDQGADIVSIEGTAEPAPDAPLPGENPAYWAKYGAAIDAYLGGAEKFGHRYSNPIRIRVTRAVATPG